MSAKLKTKPCGTCAGTGALPADDVGLALRIEREKAGITARALANAMSISDSYVLELERGTRRFTNELLAAYQKALEGLITDGQRE